MSSNNDILIDISHIIRNNDTHTLSILNKNGLLKNKNKLLYDVCRANNLEMAKWIYKTKDRTVHNNIFITKEVNDPNNKKFKNNMSIINHPQDKSSFNFDAILYDCAYRGHYEIIGWLLTINKFSSSVLHKSFCQACKSSVKAIKLIDMYYGKTIDIRLCINNAFRNNNLGTLSYLFRRDRVDFLDYIFGEFMNSNRNCLSDGTEKNLLIWGWLSEITDYKLDLSFENDLLFRTCRYLPMLQWLYKIKGNHITIDYNDNEMFKKLIVEKRYDIISWIIKIMPEYNFMFPI